IIWLIFVVSAFGQDPQFSQYYNSPLYLNPAFTGTGENTRLGANYRTQWLGVGNPFVTYSVFADHFIEPYNSGVGLMLKRDKQGATALRSTELGLFYSYHVDLNEEWVFRPALQTSFVVRDVDFSSAIFGDQLTNNGHTGGSTSDQLFIQDPNYSFLDFNTGGIIYNRSVWIGVSGHHLSRPSQSFSQTAESPLPLKLSVHGGYKIPLNYNAYRDQEIDKSIIPTFNYRKQGPFHQLDLGTYVIYDPVMFGVWYRGIPVARYPEGIKNNESIILMAGFNHNSLSVGYSFDVTVSSLTLKGGGAHEISLIYEFEYPYNTKKKYRKTLPCPDFNRKRKIF
ncbi:MAG TPA: type IX secretion system membrane protein PorP/SprF, partial [Cytophagaceae bacterium]